MGKGVSMAALCRAFGISRQTGYKWLRRFLDAGRTVAALEERSRRPKHSPKMTSARIEAAILGARDRYPRWGARKLRTWMLRQVPRPPFRGLKSKDIPAASTVGAVLRRHGLTRPRVPRRRTPPDTQPFHHCDGPNVVWCVDFKGWFRTQDGQACYPLTIMDAFSRKLLRCEGMRETDGPKVKVIFESAFEEFGVPTAIRSDNGPPFASTGLGGMTKLSAWWTRLRIRHERIDPGKPQQNGRHERMHLTLKEETTNPSAATLRSQQVVFDAFLETYNSERPHEALGGRTPNELYVNSPQRMPKLLTPIEYPYDCEVRNVRQDGTTHIRRYELQVGRALAGEAVGFRWLSAQKWEVLYGPITLGIFDLFNQRLIGPKRARPGRRFPKANEW